MLRSIVVLVVVSIVTSGCYLGRTPSAKQGAYVANGLVGVVGGVMLATAGGDCPAGADVSCQGQAGTGQMVAGVALLGGALIGTLVTLLVPTREPAPPIRVVSSPHVDTVSRGHD